jgi:hypothetical protein
MAISEESNYETELSTETLAALNSFLLENQNLKVDHENENWSLAQFWYADETREILAKESLKMSNGGSIAIVSAPSIFFKLSELKVSNHVILFEYDKRFEEEFGKERFCFYDCDKPEEIPSLFEHNFDFVIGDPPRLYCFFLFDYFLIEIKKHVLIFTEPYDYLQRQMKPPLP